MNGFVLVSFALVALFNITEALFFTPISPVVQIASGATAAQIATANAAASTASTAAAGAFATNFALVGGAVILKGLVVGALILASRNRGKRSTADDNNAVFSILANSEPAQCYRRLICDLAAGAIPDNDNIVSLFDEDVSIQSPKFEFATAAKVGKLVKKAMICEIRYSCPLSTLEIQKLFN